MAASEGTYGSNGARTGVGGMSSLIQVAGGYNINCVILGKHCEESLEAALAVGVLNSTSSPATRDQNGEGVADQSQ